jgi:hypothetical protein
VKVTSRREKCAWVGIAHEDGAITLQLGEVEFVIAHRE